MSARLTVIFYIILCLEAGVALTLLPWVHPFGMGDWGDNFLLLYAAQKTGLQSLPHFVGSGWVRGAVTGLGLLNLGMAFWEIFHFRQTLRIINSTDAASEKPSARVSDYERHDDTSHDAAE
ncbi:MAG: hypothetical protein NVSMB56_14170 [Pyrinomonadaceae bacterium]